MIPVVSKTEPAELVPALAAGHVHTALVLFNVALAFGTGLGVQFDPNRRIIRPVVDFIKPLLQKLTINGLVCTFLAQKTKEGLTGVAVDILKSMRG